MRDTARRAFVATVVVGGIVVAALALWKLKLLIAILFMAFIIAAAMRPGVDALRRRRIPRGIGIGIHYVGLFAAVGLLLYFVVPTATEQVQEAIPTSGSELEEETDASSGVRRQFLEAVQDRLEDLPDADQVAEQAFDPARRDHGDRLRGPDRHPLHARLGRLLDLRARPGDQPRDVAPAPAAPEDRARHLGSDRREARRLRPWPAHPDRPRRHGPLDLVSGDRTAVLASDRDLRGSRGAHPRRRPARRRRPRGRRGVHRVGRASRSPRG